MFCVNADSGGDVTDHTRLLSQSKGSMGKGAILTLKRP